MERENTNFQIPQNLLCYSFVIVMIFVQLLRGPGGEEESIVGLTVCSTTSWTLFTALLILAVLFTFIALRIANKEYEEKKDANYQFIRGDQ